MRPQPPPRRRARLRRCRRGAALLGFGLPRRALGRMRAWLAPAADRRAFGGGPEQPGAAARLARRVASNIELAALPAAVDWPSLKKL